MTNARGMKNQTCHCINETKTQTAVGRDSILLAFTIPVRTPPITKFPAGSSLLRNPAGSRASPALGTQP